MYLPCKSHFSPILRNGLATDLQRTWNGIKAEEKRIRSEPEVKSKKSQINHINPFPFLIYSGAYAPWRLSRKLATMTRKFIPEN